MISSLQKELQYFFQISNVQKINSIYFGGGTPSLAPPQLVSAIIETTLQCSKLDESAEITLEVNPTSIEEGKLSDFRQHGVNRVSIGTQALNNEDLKTLGREHTKEQALSCFNKAMDLYDGRVSVDFMFGRPRQTLLQWKSELKEITSLGCDHVSLYQLTMKKRTPMERNFRKGKIKLPKDNLLAEMYEASVQMLKEVGLQRYEVSNFAKPGHESIHNQAYWNGTDYIGIGPGAHGRLTITSQEDLQRQPQQQHLRRNEFQQVSNPQRWLRQVSELGHGIKINRMLTLQQQFEEMILMGLRTRQGIDIRCFHDMTGMTHHNFMELSIVKDLVAEGYLENDDSMSIRVTPDGFNLLDSITREIIFAVEENL